MTSTRIPLLLLLIGPLWGCSTTMTGARVGASPSGNLQGVPINMTKPQFEVTHTPGATAKAEATTTVTVKYVADYDRRYVLNIDPNWLTSAGIGFALGPEGQLVSVNSTSSSNATAIVQTVGKIATALAATGVLDEADTYDQLAVAIQKETMIATETLPPNSCLAGLAYKADLVPRTALPQEASGARAQLVERLKMAKDVPELQGQFRYTSVTELRILKAVRCSLEAAYANQRAQLKEKQTASAASIPKKLEARAVEFAAIAENPDKRQIERVSALARLQSLLTKAGTGLEYGIKTAELVNYAPPANLALVSSLVDMELSEWQRRRVLAARWQVDHFKREVLLNGCDAPGKDGKPPIIVSAQCVRAISRLANAQEELATALNRMAEYRIVETLDAQILAQADQKSGVDPKTYQQLRTASNQAKTDIANALTALMKTPDPTPTVPVVREEVLMLKGTSGAVPKVEWILDETVKKIKEAETLPDFVIVISKETAQ